jgi:hypothetical protein
METTSVGAYTTGDVARMFGCPRWCVARVFEDGAMPPAARAGRYRMIPASDLGRLKDVLVERGFVKDEAEAGR